MLLELCLILGLQVFWNKKFLLFERAFQFMGLFGKINVEAVKENLGTRSTAALSGRGCEVEYRELLVSRTTVVLRKSSLSFFFILGI